MKPPDLYFIDLFSLTQIKKSFFYLHFIDDLRISLLISRFLHPLTKQFWILKDSEIILYSTMISLIVLAVYYYKKMIGKISLCYRKKGYKIFLSTCLTKILKEKSMQLFHRVIIMRICITETLLIMFLFTTPSQLYR